MDKILGIDLGTTNSAVAMIVNGQPQIVENSEGDRTAPSIVSFLTEDHYIVGKKAKERASEYPQVTVNSIKRFIGCSYEERTSEKDSMSYTTARAADGGICVQIKMHERSHEEIQNKVHELVAAHGARMGMNYVIDDIDGREYSPTQISSAILTELKQDAEAQTGETFSKAVISVPAYFNDSQRQATRIAGEQAGLDVMRIINEPTAAALAYGSGFPDLDETVLVFDLGGGTFDASLLRIDHGLFNVLATSGDNRLGGDDWDWRLATHIADCCKKETGYDPRSDASMLNHLKQLANTAKVELSNSEMTVVRIPIPSNNESTGLFEIPITRKRFEGMTQGLRMRIKNTLQEIMRVLEKQELELDKVVLVGGSTRMPAIRSLVETYTGIKPDTSVNPDEAIALGAAVQGALLSGEIKGIQLQDVTPLSLGIKIKGGLVATIIPRSSSVPVQESRTFTTTEDDQTSVIIEVVQGERGIAADNKHLGSFRLENLPKHPAGTVKIEVIFSIDSNNILSVVAREKSLGIEQQLSILGSHELSSEEIRQIIALADQHKEEDEALISRENTEEEAASALRSTRRLLSMYVSMLDEDEANKLRMKTNKLADSIDSHADEKLIEDLTEEIRSLRDKLNERAMASGDKDVDGWTIDNNASKSIRERWNKRESKGQNCKRDGKLW